MTESLIVMNTGARATRGLLPRLEGWLQRWSAERGANASPPGRCTPSELSARETPTSRLVAVGGDGTANLALDWLRERGARVPLGIVPAGTGNNLARGLGIPLAWDRALALALEGETTRSIDAGLCRVDDSEERVLLVQVGGLGFPATVAADYDRMRRRAFTGPLFRRLGDLSYRLLALRRLLAARGGQLEGRITVDGESFESEFLGLFIGNEGTIGGSFRPCPEAILDDGAIDLAVVVAPRFRDAVRLFRRLTAGTHVEEMPGRARVISRRFTRTLEVVLEEERPLLVDGDLPIRGRKFIVEVLPGRFPIVVPARIDVT